MYKGDPFATPSRMRVRVPQKYCPTIQHRAFANRSRRIGLENYLASVFAVVVRKMAERRGSGKSGIDDH